MPYDWIERVYWTTSARVNTYQKACVQNGKARGERGLPD